MCVIEGVVRVRVRRRRGVLQRLGHGHVNWEESKTERI